MAILEVKNLEKHFGGTRVLNDISFSLEKGQALSIIGSSGSGKPTTAAPFPSTARRCSTPLILPRSWKRKFAASGSTSVWCFRTSTSFPSTRRCKT